MKVSTQNKLSRGSVSWVFHLHILPGEPHRRSSTAEARHMNDVYSNERSRGSSVNSFAAETLPSHQQKCQSWLVDAGSDELYGEDETRHPEYDESNYSEEAQGASKPQSLQSADHRSGGRAVSRRAAHASYERPSNKEVNQQEPMQGVDTKSEWTHASIYTTTNTPTAVNFDDLPSIPEIPAQHHQLYEHSTGVIPDPSIPGIMHDQRGGQPPFSSPHIAPGSRDHDLTRTFGPLSIASARNMNRPPPRRQQTEADRRKYLFRGSESDVGSSLTATNKRYLRRHQGNIREVDPEKNPFVDQDSIRRKKNASRDE
jgi:hypothetical protein